VAVGRGAIAIEVRGRILIRLLVAVAQTTDHSGISGDV
jgi:hypothetical protein